MSRVPRDFQIDPKKKDMVLELVGSETSPFYEGHRKGAANQRNVLFHAMTLAYKGGVRKSFKGGYSVFQNSILQKEERSLIMAIAISEIGIEALFPDKAKEVYKMAQEYASSGIDIVYNMVFKAGRGEPIFAFEADISFFKNKIFKQDILKLLKRLPDQSVDMVYGDADYNVGIGYHGRSFRKKFDEYIEWYIELTRESIRVLKNEGNLMMINYPKPNAHLRIKFLEENTYSVHEYVWTYNTNIGQTKRYFTSAHRSILHAVKTKNNNFFKENVAELYLNPGPVRQKNMKKIMESNPDLSEDEAEEIFKKKYKGRMPYSWINEPLVKNVSEEKTIHPCQIPKKVSRKLIHACTEPEDTVLVLFGGSGSECEVCKESKRNFITTEIHEKYNKMIKERIKQGKIPDKYRHHLRKNY